jgi:SNF2 family DNA or RNA helicase
MDLWEVRLGVCPGHTPDEVPHLRGHGRQDQEDGMIIGIGWDHSRGDRRIAIHFPYDEKVIGVLKRLKSSPKAPPWYDGSLKAWVIPDDMALYEAVTKALDAPGRTWEVHVDTELAQEVLGYSEAKSRAYESSRAPEAVLDVPTKIPLYPFQKAGVRWIDDRRGRALNADEMGTGKSCQSLGWIVLRKQTPALVLCPATLKANWYREVEKFTALKPMILSSASGLKSYLKLGFQSDIRPLVGYDIVIANYDLLEVETIRSWIVRLAAGDLSVVPDLVGAGLYALAPLDREIEKTQDASVKARLMDARAAIDLSGFTAKKRRNVKASINGMPIAEFLSFGFRTLVCDESHYIKDFGAQRTKGVFELARKIRNVIGLTGTPLLNRPKELWSQVYCINPRIFPKFKAFADRYCAAKKGRFGMDYSGASNLDELERVLRSEVMIRRTKEQVMPELPPKIRITIPLVLGGGLAKYNQEAAQSLERLREIRRARDEWKLQVGSLNDVDRARFLAEHAAEAAANSRLTGVAVEEIEKLKILAVTAKLGQAAEFIVNAHDQEGPVVVFMAHHAPMDLMTAALSKAGLYTARIDGRVDIPTRQGIVETFQKGEVDALICGIRAAGEGLTLTAAHTVIFAELDWSFSIHDQAESRCHRITQSRPVIAYYLIALGTIECPVMSLIDSKREVINAVVGNSEQTIGEGGILDSLIFEALK